jgi:hypothetical protein
MQLKLAAVKGLEKISNPANCLRRLQSDSENKEALG